MVRQTPFLTFVMAPPSTLGVWSMARVLGLPPEYYYLIDIRIFNIQKCLKTEDKLLGYLWGETIGIVNVKMFVTVIGKWQTCF